jgi:hypothetical protein
MGKGGKRSNQSEMTEKAKVRCLAFDLGSGFDMRERELNYKRKSSPTISDLSLDTIVSGVNLR